MIAQGNEGLTKRRPLWKEASVFTGTPFSGINRPALIVGTFISLAYQTLPCSTECLNGLDRRCDVSGLK